MPDEASLPHYSEIRMWSMRIFGLIIIVFGAVLAVGGVKLAALGGSLYYLLVGITLIFFGGLTIAGRGAGLYVYFVAFLGTCVYRKPYPS